MAHRFAWDNTDIRVAKQVNVAGHTLLWGATVNNNPTVQDVWNTTPAWSFPFISSALAPMPTASTFIEQVYAQQVAGLSGYSFLDDTFYLEFGGYWPLGTNAQRALGIYRQGRARSAASHPTGGLRPSRFLANTRGNSAPSASRQTSFRWELSVPATIRSPISASIRSINI